VDIVSKFGEIDIGMLILSYRPGGYVSFGIEHPFVALDVEGGPCLPVLRCEKFPFGRPLRSVVIGV